MNMNSNIIEGQDNVSGSSNEVILEEIEKYHEKRGLFELVDLEKFKNEKAYYNWLSILILNCKEFDDEEIETLAMLVRTPWVGKRGRKINVEDEHFVLARFYALQELTGEPRPSRIEAIKIIMRERTLSQDAASKLYDKVMKRLGLLGAKRGRKKRETIKN